MRDGETIVSVSVHGQRVAGVVKWVKDAYGFVQSATHAEDLFYHSSEVKAHRTLEAGDEVEFLVVRNPFTGKLNATQIHLLNAAAPPHASANPSPLQHAETAGMVERMKSLCFSDAQIQDALVSFQAHLPSGGGAGGAASSSALRMPGLSQGAAGAAGAGKPFTLNLKP